MENSTSFDNYMTIDGRLERKPGLAAVKESFMKGATNPHVRDDMERFIMTFKLTELEIRALEIYPPFKDGVTELKVLEREREKFRKLKRWTEASVKRGSEPPSSVEFYRFMIGLMTKRIRKERADEKKGNKG